MRSPTHSRPHAAAPFSRGTLSVPGRHGRRQRGPLESADAALKTPRGPACEFDSPSGHVRRAECPQLRAWAAGETAVLVWGKIWGTTWETIDSMKRHQRYHATTWL